MLLDASSCWQLNQVGELQLITAAEEEQPFTPKRGRPTKVQVAAIDRSILNVARNLFLTEGYANTRMEAIAASIGISKATLYSRYPDKPTLFSAIVSDMLTRSSNLVSDDTLFGAGSTAEQLFRFGSLFLERMLTTDAVAFDKLIISEADKFPELALEFHEQGYVKAVRRLAERIEFLEQKQGWPTTDSLGLATVFIAGLIGWVRREGRVRTLSRADCDAFAARSVALLVGGRTAW